MMARSIIIFFLITSWSNLLCQFSFAQGPAAFPSINQATQGARDADRRQILSDELQAERQALAEAQTKLVTGFTVERAADVHRHSENIESLRRELQSIPESQLAPPGPMRVVAKTQRPVVAARRTSNGAAAFWNPYNRASDPAVSIDFSTTRRRDLP